MGLAQLLTRCVENKCAEQIFNSAAWSSLSTKVPQLMAISIGKIWENNHQTSDLGVCSVYYFQTTPIGCHCHLPRCFFSVLHPSGFGDWNWWANNPEIWRTPRYPQHSLKPHFPNLNSMKVAIFCKHPYHSEKPHVPYYSILMFGVNTHPYGNLCWPPVVWFLFDRPSWGWLCRDDRRHGGMRWHTGTKSICNVSRKMPKRWKRGNHGGNHGR